MGEIPTNRSIWRPIVVILFSLGSLCGFCMALGLHLFHTGETLSSYIRSYYAKPTLDSLHPRLVFADISKEEPKYSFYDSLNRCNFENLLYDRYIRPTSRDSNLYEIANYRLSYDVHSKIPYRIDVNFYESDGISVSRLQICGFDYCEAVFLSQLLERAKKISKQGKIETK